MIDYGKWKEDKLNITTLKLDPRNPRIPESGAKLSQRDLIAELVENDKVYDLAKRIADDGYYPVESLIVVEENGDKYVVEGNRRLAALKLLFSPQTAPETFEQRFRSLSNRIDPNAISKVRVVKAPSREAAAPIIMSRHTRTQVANWSPLMQAKFYRNLVEGGVDSRDIAEQYNISVSEINDALQQYTMYTIACSLELPDEVAKKVQNPREFPITVLERLYKNPKVNHFLGISFDNDKRLIGLIQPNEFKKGYAKVVSDIVNHNVDTRSLNTIAEMDRYLASFGKQKPNLRKPGGFTSEHLVSRSLKGGTTVKVLATKKKKPASKRTQWGLIPTSFSCDVNNQRINDVFNELKKLAVVQYPNAVGLMFRSLLEMSIGYYLDRTGDLEKLTDAQRQKRKARNQSLPNDWHPTLRQMLQYSIDEGTRIIPNPNMLKALQKVVAQKESLISVDTLDLFVHNQHFYPNEETLRNFWNQLQGVFEIILTEPAVGKTP